MRRIKIYQKLAWLNDLSAERAELVFRECSDLDEWACRMAAARSFVLLDDLFETAAAVSAEVMQDEPARPAPSVRSPEPPVAHVAIEHQIIKLIES